MVTLFNRKELLTTFDMKRQGQVRALLQNNGIDYRVKTISRGSPSPFFAGTRTRVGSFGENPALSYEYKIYVRKTDYDRATTFLMNE